MQISGPSKWLNKLKRPQGPGQLVPPSTPYTLPPTPLYPHLIAFYFSNIYYYRILKRYPNAKMHVRWPRCTSDITHMHIYRIEYIHLYIYIPYIAISYWVVRCENAAKARDVTRPILTLHETTHYPLCPFIPSAFIPASLSLFGTSLPFVWMGSVTDLATLSSVIRYAIYL